MCGQTEISAAEVRKVMGELSMQHDPCSAATGYEHQFQVRKDNVILHSVHQLLDVLLCV